MTSISYLPSLIFIPNGDLRQDAARSPLLRFVKSRFDREVLNAAHPVSIFPSPGKKTCGTLKSPKRETLCQQDLFPKRKLFRFRSQQQQEFEEAAIVNRHFYKLILTELALSQDNCPKCDHTDRSCARCRSRAAGQCSAAFPCSIMA